ncbi:MAG TPA: radical SAM protein [Candidatus Magasanikbacteria bacterium]|nr:radical SAM protein [Candidatus Magasanikbacteria bacterium]
MNLLTLESRGSIKGGTGYFLRTADDFRILAADTLLREDSGVTRKLGISVSSGCQVGCRYCFTNKYGRYRRLSPEELCGQVKFLLANNPSKSCDTLKISLKQMGDPLLNARNVVLALRKLAVDFPDAMMVVSTAAPRVEEDFFGELQRLQDEGVNIRLQFSCHTTDDNERNYLSPKIRMMRLEEIGDMANHWRGQLVTLNFVIMEGYTYNVTRLEKIFSPEKVFIKVNYIDPNSQTAKFNFHDAESKKTAFVSALHTGGYQLAYRHM